MKKAVCCWLIIFYAFASFAISNADSLIDQLNNVIKQSQQFDNNQLKIIDATRARLVEVSGKNMDAQYDATLKMYSAYQYYNFDSALHYAKKLIQIALLKKERLLLVDAKLKEIFIMLSGGFFKETLDSLQVISLRGATNNLKAEYYSLLARAYYNFADFDNDNIYTPAYNKRANNYLDSALALYPVNDFEFTYYLALQQLKKGYSDSAFGNLNKLLNQKNLGYHQIALVTSTLGGMFMGEGKEYKARPYLILASIADIKSSTKETLALLILANIIFKEGDIKNAALYIEKANADATFYNARLRKVQIAAILPLIEGEMIKTIQLQKQRLIISLLLFSLFILLLAGFALIVRMQVKKLRVARQSLLFINQQLIDANNLKEKYNGQLKETNQQLVEANLIKEQYNTQLKEINQQLSEANKIKEEYIGYYFRIDTEFLARIEKLMVNIDKKLLDRKWDEIKLLVKSLDIKKEKEELLKNFDIVFLKLFPNFVTQFNSLFPPEDRIEIKEDQYLTTELRIFALMRLGITENEKIANILNYSINTIYSYKTKIRNKANIAKDSFDQKVIEITTLGH